MTTENPSDVLNTYFSDVKDLQNPSPDQEHKWFSQYEKMREGPKRTALRGKIASGYLKFVIQQALKRTKDRQVLGDLINEGNAGLLEAIDKFEVERGHRFLTYAAWWINVRMQGFQHGNRAVHIPQQVIKAQRKKKKAEDIEMARGLRTEYSFVEVRCTDVEKVMVANPEEEHEVSSGKTMQLFETAGLTRRESLVLVWFFGLRGGAAKNLDEITNLLMLLEGGMPSRDSVRELKDDALEVIRSHLKDEEIQSILEL